MKYLYLLGALFFSSSLLGQSFNEPIKLQPFELRWMNHEDPTTTYKSSDHPQAVFVIEAYFRNCPYCNDNAPNVDALRDHYVGNELVQILDVSSDCSARAYREWISMHNPNHPVLNDCNWEVLGPLNVTAMPTAIILDCNFNELYRSTGTWGSNTVARIRSVIDRQLAAGCE